MRFLPRSTHFLPFSVKALGLLIITLPLLSLVSTTATATPQSATLLRSVKIKIPYGEAVLPAGMKLEVISREGNYVRVNYMNSAETLPADAVHIDSPSADAVVASPATPAAFPSPSAAVTPAPSVAVSPAQYVSLAPWLSSPSLWQTSTGDFSAARTFGFRWISDNHEAARAASQSLRLGDMPVAEVIARFSSENSTTSVTGSSPAKLSAIQVSIYNRGDSGQLAKSAFDALVEHSRDAVTALTGTAALERGTDNGSAVQSRGLVWATSTSRFLLEWSDTPANPVQGRPYRAEFIRLRVTPQGAPAQSYLDQVRAQSALAAGAAQPTTVRPSDLKARVVKHEDGAELLPNIPMVNQGRKGYCVTAATERVLRYYGAEVDQNELAEIADADARAGTNLDTMVDALKKLASRFRILVITEYRLTYSDFVREINDYNRIVRNAPKTVGASPIGGASNYSSALHQIKGELLVESRTKLNSAGMTSFEADVQRHIERGIPLLWSVQLGLLPEEKLNPQAQGGHMRLIVGLNSKTHEIYYSDTWGLGHELKKMSLANAWTITNGLFTLEPG